MKKTLADIGGVVNPTAEVFKPPRLRLKHVDRTFGIYTRRDGRLQMGNKTVEMSDDGKL